VGIVYGGQPHPTCRCGSTQPKVDAAVAFIFRIDPLGPTRFGVDGYHSVADELTLFSSKPITGLGSKETFVHVQHIR